MNIEMLVQYISMGIAIAALIIDHKGMKRYIPVAMFASLYANIWCYLSNYFHWWEFPVRVLPGIKDISFAANIVAVPVLAIFWIRYSPMPRINWALLWSLILTIFEYVAQKYSAMVEYHNGYTAYHSFVLWLISWYIWYQFHQWFYKDGWKSFGK